MTDYAERARAWMNDNEADLTSAAWSGLPESLAVLLIKVRNEAFTEAANCVLQKTELAAKNQFYEAAGFLIETARDVNNLKNST